MNKTGANKKPHCPERTCLGCYSKKNKYDLVRIILSADGTVMPDPSGKGRGRGAYVCADMQCLENAIKKRRFDRAFRCTIEKKFMEKLKAGFLECLKTRLEH